MSEVIKPTIKEVPGVSNELFNAFKNGNIMWPQYSFAIKVFTANALLHEGQPDWKQFAESKWSSEQEVKLSQLMADSHHRNAVPIAMEGYLEPGDMKIKNDKRLSVLWKATKSYVVADMLNFIGRKSWKWNQEGYPMTLVDSNIPRIAEYMSSPDNRGQIQKIRIILQNIEDFFMQNPQLQRSGKHRDDVIAAFKRGEKLSPSYVDLGNDLFKYLENQMPGENFEWVVWGV